MTGTPYKRSSQDYHGANWNESAPPPTGLVFVFAAAAEVPDC